MIRHFAVFSFTALAVSLVSPANLAFAQTRTSAAPNRALSNPFGSTSAVSGQARPLGGIPTSGYRNSSTGRYSNGYNNGYSNGYANGHSRDNRGQNGHGYGNGAAVGGYYPVYVPGYSDFGVEPAPGPYSYTLPSYQPALPPGPPAPDVPAGAPAPPPVIINQYFGYPGPPPGGPAPVGDVSQAQPEGVARPGDPLAEPQNYYLIAYKDHSVHAALTYWVEGNTLHYVTTDNAHNQISLDLVDGPTSTRLNSDHNVAFSVPGR